MITTLSYVLMEPGERVWPWWQRIELWELSLGSFNPVTSLPGREKHLAAIKAAAEKSVFVRGWPDMITGGPWGWKYSAWKTDMERGGRKNQPDPERFSCNSPDADSSSPEGRESGRAFPGLGTAMGNIPGVWI